MAVRPPPASLLRHAALGALIVGFVVRVLVTLARHPHLIPGLVPTSWHRTPTENRAAGGATFSQHLLALALDFDYVTDDDERLEELAEAFEEAGFGHVEHDRKHVHVQELAAEDLLAALS